MSQHNHFRAVFITYVCIKFMKKIAFIVEKDLKMTTFFSKLSIKSIHMYIKSVLSIRRHQIDIHMFKLCDVTITFAENKMRVYFA